MDEDWGPWIAHDGKGCPCVGMWVQAVFDRPSLAGHGTMLDGVLWEGRATGITSWVWAHRRARIIRYRIRRPKALRELIDMVENLPVKEDA